MWVLDFFGALCLTCWVFAWCRLGFKLCGRNFVYVCWFVCLPLNCGSFCLAGWIGWLDLRFMLIWVVYLWFCKMIWFRGLVFWVAWVLWLLIGFVVLIDGFYFVVILFLVCFRIVSVCLFDASLDVWIAWYCWLFIYISFVFGWALNVCWAFNFVVLRCDFDAVLLLFIDLFWVCCFMFRFPWINFGVEFWAFFTFDVLVTVLVGINDLRVLRVGGYGWLATDFDCGF